MIRPSDARPAPELVTTDWLHTDAPLTLAGLRGRVVMIHAFQMLCPGCVARGLPQMQRAAELFAPSGLVVLGLHSVFEHHEAMRLPSLRAFVHEYRIRFPVGVDAPAPDGSDIPQTMRAYAMRGTPTTLLVDARGRLRQQVFGAHDDLRLGAELAQLLLEAQEHEADDAPSARGPDGTSAQGDAPGARREDAACGPDACPRPTPTT